MTDLTHPSVEPEPPRTESVRSSIHDSVPANEADQVPALVDRILSAVTQQETPRLPTATYRVQFNAGCTFRDVRDAVPYLETLGISDLYASPFLQARPGSVHGYDIVDHASINSEIGTLEELRSLRAVLREHHMGLIADVVPNHMSATPRLNAWWQDVLENGPSSSFAAYFDIDWMPLKPDLAHKVLLPVLGEQFGHVLEDGQLVVKYGEGSFWLEYFDQRYPIAPRSYAIILTQRLDELRRRLGDEHTDVQELLSILTAIKNLPQRTETDVERLIERRREKEVIKRRLHGLEQHSQEIAGFVSESVRLINGRPGDPQSFDRLDELLQDQAYRLAYWRVASDEINYRRFFDINELAAICTEHPQVFAESHRLLFDLIDDGTVTGVRIDHPDGLYDPRGYLCQLQEQHFLRLCRQEWHQSVGRALLPVPDPQTPPTAAATPASPDPTPDDDLWPTLQQRLLELWRASTRIPGSPLARPLYTVVEKILAQDEPLPSDWPVHGTVGYEFLNAVNGVFVDRHGERPLSATYTRFTRQSLDFDELTYQCKRLIVRMSMSSELTVLGHRLDRISERNRWTRDFTLSSLTRALQEVVACFPVYRTYVQPDRVLDRDRVYIEQAVARAKRRNPAMSASIFDLVRNVLLLRYHDRADDAERQAVQNFAGKFQQLTGPIMAKAVEDTAFYRFNRLLSLNEVGGEPAQFGTPVSEFHQLNQSRLLRLTHTLNATSTHDTKRSEDVRARINVLSEIPREWREHVQRWSLWNRRLKTDLDGTAAPSRNAECLLYQTLVGTWPDSVLRGAERVAYIGRIQQHMLKVVREAKVNTSWVSPHEAYEAALARFVEALFVENRRQPFLNHLDEFSRRIADHGRWNSLSQLVLKIASPGVPDFYQGTELWTLTLVDPDNRHPVDLAARRRMLDELLAEMTQALDVESLEQAAESWLTPLTSEPDSHVPDVAAFLQRLLNDRADGRIKLFVTLMALHARRRFPKLFTDGEYLPLVVVGKFAEHVVAFARRYNDQTAVVIAPRLTVGVTGFGGPPPIGELWADTRVELPDSLRGRSLCDAISRQTASLPNADAPPCLRAADVLVRLPVALLVGGHAA